MSGWSFLFAFPDQLAELKASNTQERFDSCHGKDLHAFWEQDMKTVTVPVITSETVVQVMHLHWKLAICPAMLMSYA